MNAAIKLPHLPYKIKMDCNEFTTWILNNLSSIWYSFTLFIFPFCTFGIFKYKHPVFRQMQAKEWNENNNNVMVAASVSRNYYKQDITKDG